MSLYTEWLEICKTYEFPHSHFYNSDLKEVLQMFAFLKEQYGKLLKVVDDINAKMDTLDVKIAEDISKALIPYTEKINNVIIETDRKIEELENFVLNQNSKTLSEVNLLITTEKIDRNSADLELLDLIQKNTELLEVSIKELENKIIESGMAVIKDRKSVV